MKNKRNVLIMAGGTGGHVFPGLALAEEMAARGFDINWLGTARGIEAKLVPVNNIPLHLIAISGVRGRGLVRLLLAPLAVILSVLATLKILLRLKPCLVVGFGGYVSGPGGIAARLLRIPLVVHEQNAIAGTTNKYLAKFASKVATAFPNVFPKGVFVGNPLRKDIVALAPKQPAEGRCLNILVMGGSRGARAINQLMPEAIALLTAEVNVMHQTGEADLAATKKAYAELDVSGNREAVAFINDMNEAFAWADLVVCRSGASTVTEVAQVGLPAIFIPFPFAIDDHQTANAKYLADVGAAVIVQQQDATKELLSDLIETLVNDSNRLMDMGKQAKCMAVSDATKKLADLCEELING